MKYKLGLDVGTASVGLVAYELDDSGKPISVPYHSVRIFKEPLLPPAKGAGIGELKQAARRKTRQQMRLHQRRARRLRKLAHLAPPLFGIDIEAVARRRKPHILEVRAQAATEKVALEDLLRIFLHLSKRRGYAGTFRARKGGKPGVVEEGIGGLREKMNEAGCETLGEYLLHRRRRGQHLRLKEAGLYAQREMIQSEFDRIWTTQAGEHEQLSGGHEGRPLREIFHEAIFHQRPIRILSAGNCELETSLPRSPLVQPAFQEFRTEKQIADLRWAKKGRRHPKPLEKPAKELIRNLLFENERVKFEEIYKALEEAGIPPAPDEYLNLSEGGREELRGNSTDACMKKLGLEQDWQNLTHGHRITALNLLADAGSPDVFDEMDWHKKFARRRKTKADGSPAFRCIPREVVKFVNSMMDTRKFDWLSKMGFEAGRSAYSIKALRGLAAAMKERNLDEAEAKALLYPQAASATEREELFSELPPHERTGNVVVDVSLRQVRREVNAAIRKLGGPPDSMIIELSRDMPLGVKRRREIMDRINKNRNARKKAAREIENHTGKSASDVAIKCYLLWREQDKQCPYCGEAISLPDALDGLKTNRDHIIPRSITRIGKSRDYLILAHHSCNDEKGARTPREKWGNDPERWKVIEKQAKRFGGKKMLGKMRQILSKESGESLLDNEEIKDFSARQFHQTSWIAKNCAEWMKTICSNVAVSRGFLTASLRRKWGLDTVIPEVRFEKDLPVFDEDKQLITPDDFGLYRAHWEGKKDSEKTQRRIDKRIDYRHHLIDAMVIGLTSRGLYQQMARAYKRDAERAAPSTARRKIPLRAKPPISDIRELALDLVRNCNLTHKRDRWPAGPFFTEQPLSVVEIDGRRWFAQRKTLAEIAAGGVETTIRKQIERIVSESTREAVLKAFNQRIESGKSPEEALSEQILDPYYGQPIRRVKVRDTARADGAVLVEHHGKLQNKPFGKYMKTKGYACLELDTQRGGARLVTLYEAMKSGRSETPNRVRFFKGDTVLDTRDEKRYVVRQIWAKGGGTLILTLHTETREVKDMGGDPGKKSVTGRILSELTLISDAWPPHSSD